MYAHLYTHNTTQVYTHIYTHNTYVCTLICTHTINTHTHSGVLFIPKQEDNPAIHDSIGEPRGHRAERNKPDAEGPKCMIPLT